MPCIRAVRVKLPSGQAREEWGALHGTGGSCSKTLGDTLPAAPGLGEDSTLEPTNPYSAAKAGAEMMARAYLTSYRLPVITTRSNNVYGPHQFPEKMIPKFTLLASRGQDLPVHGDGARPAPVSAASACARD